MAYSVLASKTRLDPRKWHFLQRLYSVFETRIQNFLALQKIYKRTTGLLGHTGIVKANTGVFVLSLLLFFASSPSFQKEREKAIPFSPSSQREGRSNPFSQSSREFSLLYNYRYETSSLCSFNNRRNK